jgi:SAM-dependent methyltransferase
MFKEIERFLQKPELYTPSTGAFWDDPHISEGMLSAHLEPENHASSRKHDFIDKSVEWIAKVAPPDKYKNLLDLGCGPGLYTQRFYKTGYDVTGIDFSERSIRYAKVEASLNKQNIEYHYKNYMTISFNNRYDIITLIYCDYAALPSSDKTLLLYNVYKALKPGGKFILDVFTHKMRLPESHSWYYTQSGGFFSDKPHLCLNSVYQYIEDRAELRQSIVITDDDVQCYNVWDCFYSKEELVSEIMPVGFSSYDVYGNIAGKKYSDNSDTICGVFTK